MELQQLTAATPRRKAARKPAAGNPGWIGGLAEWTENETMYLSVAFTWKLDEAYARAQFARSQGLRVIAGGPALFLSQMKHRLVDIAEIGTHYPEAVTRHNPNATFASRGCPVGCGFCIVPAMEGRAFTLIPNFEPRPILCDNNLSGLPADYQDYIIRRYQEAGVILRDANSGFEPLTFTPDVYARWKPLINMPWRDGNGKLQKAGPWRFAYDETRERKQVLDVMRMLSGEAQSRKRVYVLIGNEPYEECMRRIYEVIDHGCEPHCQPIMKLNALERVPWVRYDWTEERVRQVARWSNSWSWKKCKFEDWDPKRNNTRLAAKYDRQQGLYL